MSRPVVLVALMVWPLACGCADRASRDDFTPPLDVAQVNFIRNQIHRTDPAALVGVVTDTLHKQRLVAVGDVPVGDFRVGQVMIFIDARQQRLTSGVVKRITSNRLHVQYEPPPRDGRAPREGDLAVRFRSAGSSPP
jgi:hypothetical protein